MLKKKIDPGAENRYCSNFDATLLIVKSKVKPLSGLSIPRSELSGAVVMTRLLKSSLKAFLTFHTS